MRAGTNAWQRVDNAGCVPLVVRAALLGWVVLIPYCIAHWSPGWLAWSCGCVAVGLMLTWRQMRQRAIEIPEMSVDVSQSDLHPGEPFVVTLRMAGDKARTVQWWSAELMADIAGDEPKSVVTAEFAVDPAAEVMPVAEMAMVLHADVGDVDGRAWWVRVTVQTDRGRMESGRVGVRVHPL